MKRVKAAACLLLAAQLLAAPALAVTEGSAEMENTPPVAENQELETYRGVSVGGQLKAHDAEGDELAFEISTDPMKGQVELSADGYFIYTPKEGKRGKDYFGFRATDAAGSVSQEGTVIITLLRPRTKVTYADMEGSGAEYAAVALTAAGVFTAETFGGDHVFAPGDTVRRGEFLSLCMNAADRPLLRGVHSTGFLDDDEIGAWLKPYVATALLRGYIPGDEAGGSFRPSEEITLRDACVMLNAVLGVTDVVSAAAIDGEPDAAAQAVANLTACHAMPSHQSELDAPLTRADAAELLQNARLLLAGRK